MELQLVTAGKISISLQDGVHWTSLRYRGKNYIRTCNYTKVGMYLVIFDDKAGLYMMIMRVLIVNIFLLSCYILVPPPSPLEKAPWSMHNW